MKDKNLVFVYNADTGLFNVVSDWAHKVISPSTYECNLCALTHSNFGMKKEWKEFLDELNVKMEFLHKDEFEKKYGKQFNSYPCVFVKEGETMNELISKKVINQCKNLDELKEKIKISLR